MSGLFGGRLPGLPFPGGGTGFLGGTTGAAGLDGLCSSVGLSTETEENSEEIFKKKDGPSLHITE